MGDQTQSADPFEIEIPDDPLEIEALLENQSVEQYLEGTDSESEEGKDPEKSDDEPTEGEGDKPKEASKAEGDDPPESKDGKGDDKPKGEADDPSPVPKAVIRETRKQLHEAQSELTESRSTIATLQKELDTLKAGQAATREELQEKADEATGGTVDLKTLDRSKLEELKADLDDSTVEFLSGMLDVIESQRAALDELKTSRDEAQAAVAKSDAAQHQDDIDSVPLLSAIQAMPQGDAEADAVWKRAVAYEKAVTADPDFEGKSRREVYAEVGRRLEGHLGKDATAKWLGEEAKVTDDKPTGKSRDQVIEDKLAGARDRASPDSLSDLPAGAPASQNEQERLSAMSEIDLEEAMSRAFAKGGQDAVDELIARLETGAAQET